LGFGWIFSLSLLTLLPLSLFHGALFTFGCRVYHLLAGRDKTVGQTPQPSHSIGRVYAWEAIGTIFGGIIFTYVFIRWFNSFQTVFIIALLNLAVCLALLKLKGSPSRALKVLSAVFFAVFLWLVFGPGADNIHQFSINRQWENFKLLDYQNSIYGNVAVSQLDGQYSFFSNAVPVITAPYPDIAFVEEFGNIPLLFHPRPRDILIISAGAGGLINEILKHPVKNIDYLEIDPLILEMVRKYPTALTKKELSDQRVHIKYSDGRRFIKQTAESYDLVLIGVSEPSDLQKNRLFTEEFFSLAKKRLKNSGVLAFSLAGSLSYLSPQLRDVNKCILNSLKRIYPYVRVIPGDNNLFLASDCKGILKVTPQLLVKRINSRGLKTRLLSISYLEYRFDPRRLNWFLGTLKGATHKTNKDFRPLAVFKYGSYWNAQFSPYMGKILKALERVNLKILSVLVFILTGIIYFAYLSNRRFSRIGIPFCIFATGFFGMLINLILIFGFQIRYGYLYYQIGILLTAFMSGIALGSIVMTNRLRRIKKDWFVFLSLEFLIILLALIISLLIDNFTRPLFLVFCFAAGALVGSEFPLAGKMYLRAVDKLGARTGLLYSSDLIGGWLAGILGGMVFLPVLGVFNTCLVIAMLKFAGLIILVISRNNLIERG
ncbi:MAG: fused MFS/spermidine synthase, partial [Candidatus Omnitrophota bacterium]|nr:fused MFS/spermidine synthase [Candidatus Omnitrophota bacterium]